MACLEALHSYLTWIPLAYVFFTELIDIILHFVDLPQYREIATKCLTEVVALKISPEEYSQDEYRKMIERVLFLFEKFLGKIEMAISCSTSFVLEREKLSKQSRNQTENFDNFCKTLTNFFTSFFLTHKSIIENYVDNNNNLGDTQKQQFLLLVKKGLTYIVKLNELKDETIFKICQDFWHQYSEYLLN